MEYDPAELTGRVFAADEVVNAAEHAERADLGTIDLETPNSARFGQLFCEIRKRDARLEGTLFVAEVELEDKRLTRVRLVPLNVNNVEVVFQPRRLVSAEAEQVVAELRELSAPLQTQIVLDNGVGQVVLSAPLCLTMR